MPKPSSSTPSHSDALKRWHDQLGAMIDQVWHPEYSLRELVDGLRQIRDEMIALRAAPPRKDAVALLRTARKCLAHSGDGDEVGEMIDAFLASAVNDTAKPAAGRIADLSVNWNRPAPSRLP